VSQVLYDRAAVPEPLASMYAPIEKELAEVEQMLHRELRSRFPSVDEMVRYGCLLGGKRLRPALLLLSGKATGELTPDHIVLAAVMEMIHTATLVHDDVLDDADLRRHLATVNARWGDEASVLLGDYLFTHSLYLASGLASTVACRMIGRATNVVCEGELRQVHGRGDFTMTETQYLHIIEAKTAELYDCSCRLGAHFAGASAEDVERLARFGRNLGIAFQIADDLLDVTGKESTVGKSLGTDLEKQKPTLPLIHILARVNGGEREQLLSILEGEGNHRRQALLPWFERFDALAYARTTAGRYAETARQAVSSLPDTPARRVLTDMADFVVQRSK